jgi:hypothetical protein
MSAFKEFFATRKGIIAVGALIGILAALLQKFGNPSKQPRIDLGEIKC